MGLLSILGKVGAGIAAPFTGGASLAAIPAIDALGRVASGASKGSADQRASENQLALQQGQLAQGGARDQFSADLAGSNAAFQAALAKSNYGREGQDRQRKAQMLMSLLGGMGDASITPGNPAIASRMGTMSGGLRPSALGNKDALMSLLGQGDIAGPEYAAPTPYAKPTAPNMQQAGKGEKILGGIGLGASLLGSLRRPQ